MMFMGVAALFPNIHNKIMMRLCEHRAQFFYDETMQALNKFPQSMQSGLINLVTTCINGHRGISDLIMGVCGRGDVMSIINVLINKF